MPPQQGRRRAGWPARIALLVVAIAFAGASSFSPERIALVAGAEGLMAGEWVPIGDLDWEWGTTGWLGVANQHVPQRDRSFAGGPLRIGNIGYARGIGTYPLSEITYRIDGRYSRFAAAVGVDDATNRVPDGVQFRVYADGVLRYQSDVRRAGERPIDVDVDVSGAQTLRLVAVDVRQSDALLFADWGDARLLRPLLGTPLADASWAQRVRVELAQRAAQRARDDRALGERGAQLFGEIERHLPSTESGVAALNDPTGGWLGLASRDLIVAIATSEPRRGQLVVLDRSSRRAVLDGVRPGVVLGPVTYLPDARRPFASELRTVDDPPFGRGKRLRVRLPLTGGGGGLVVELTAFEDQPYFLYRLETPSLGDTPTFRFFDLGLGQVAVGDNPQYLTDFSHLRHGIVRDDGLLRHESIGPGKPLFLWSDTSGHGLLLAAIDEAKGSTVFALRRDPGRIAAAAELTSEPSRGGPDEGAVSPRLYVELPHTVDLRQSHANFKRITGALYPSAVVPGWFKYQWISWYAFNVDVDEEKLRAEIDYIADNLADLGPWNIVIDAGWYVAEGRPGADWRNVDRDKFPSGYRALVDYAHSRGVRVIGYVSAPYLDSRQRAGDWLGLRDVIEKHRDWLTELGGDAMHQSYAFDFANPEVRAYWAAVFHDLFVDDDVDGVKIDGLGNAEGAELSPGEVDAFGRVDAVADQTMEIYRFLSEQATSLKPDAYIQAGWLNPIFAHPYAHTFWYSDEYPTFSSPYPFGGLREHVDYATIQRRLLGQRPHMGNPYDQPNGSTINRWWLEAGLALGTKVAPSWDLTALSAGSLNAYRHLLVHYDAFAEDTRFGPGLYPDYFATRVDGTIYLGAINRGRKPRTIAPSFEELGLDPTATYTAFDVEADRYLRVRGGLTLDLAPRSFRLVILRRDPGVLWTGSSFTLMPRADGLSLDVRGPAAMPGDLALAAPAPREVSLDARPLPSIAPNGGQPEGYWYDESAGVLHVRYRHDTPHRIDVVFA